MSKQEILVTISGRIYGWQGIYMDNPEIHYDIGSRIDGFIGRLCSFRKKIVLIDVRPFEKM